MATKKDAPAIDPDRLYLVSFSKSFEHDGKKYVPRAGQKVRLIGSTVEQVKDKLDSYEAV